VLVIDLHVNKRENSTITQRVRESYCLKEELVGRRVFAFDA